MGKNMKRWLENVINNPVKKAMPILSFPGISLLHTDVESLVKDSGLYAECMYRTAQRFDMGISVSPMDLSVEAEAFGSEIRYSAADIPTVCKTLIQSEEAAKALQIPGVGAGRSGICVDGIKKACQKIQDRPVFAGMIGPYSLAGRLLDMTEVMILCYECPEMVETVLEKVTDFLIQYALAFKKAGANGVMIAEPAAGLLSPPLIAEFSNTYVKKIMEAVMDDEFLIIYHNCGNVTPLLSQIKQLEAPIYSFGNAVNLEEVLKVMPDDKLIMGNIDPAGILKNATPKEVAEKTEELLKRCGRYKNFVPASGCDIPPQTPFENIDIFFKTVSGYYHNFS